MNQEKFITDLKERIYSADWHKRYFSHRSRSFHRCDYWIKTLLGACGLVGVLLMGQKDWQTLGSFLAGGAAFVLGNLIPNFKWDQIVQGFADEQKEWIRIQQGYETVLSLAEHSDRSEILLQQFQTIDDLQKGAELKERNLPKSDRLLRKYEEEIRAYYKLK